MILNSNLERLTKEWRAPIYAFFHPIPTIVYEDGRRAHAFHCAATQCKHQSRGVRRFLDKGDAKSTGNMRKHARNRLSSQSIRALMCLGEWSLLGLVKDKDIHAVTVEAEVDGDDEEFAEGWDAIDN